jgi:hypothetical protein
MRAAVAGVAEPKLLRSPAVASRALRLHREVFARITSAQMPKPREFGVLRQALAYTLSVVVAALPVEGFSFMEELVGIRDQDVRWICRENLKKDRLISRFPDKVRALTAKARPLNG